MLYGYETWATQDNVSGNEIYEEKGKIHMARLQTYEGIFAEFKIKPVIENS